jgi:hypothetical protein
MSAIYMALVTMCVVIAGGGVYWFELQAAAKFKYKFFSKHALYSAAGVVILYGLGQVLGEYPQVGGTSASSIVAYGGAVLIIAHSIYRNYRHTNLVFGVTGSILQCAVLIPLVSVGLVILVFSAIMWLIPTDQRTTDEKRREKNKRFEDDRDEAWHFDKANPAGPNYEE